MYGHILGRGGGVLPTLGVSTTGVTAAAVLLPSGSGIIIRLALAAAATLIIWGAVYGLVTKLKAR